MKTITAMNSKGGAGKTVTADPAIKAVRHDGGGPCRMPETDIPRETFDICEDREPWRTGIASGMEYPALAGK